MKSKRSWRETLAVIALTPLFLIILVVALAALVIGVFSYSDPVRDREKRERIPDLIEKLKSWDQQIRRKALAELLERLAYDQRQHVEQLEHIAITTPDSLVALRLGGLVLSLSRSPSKDVLTRLREVLKVAPREFGVDEIRAQLESLDDDSDTAWRGEDF